MAPAGSSSFTVPDRVPLSRAGPEPGPTVIWLRGEHDITTDFVLSLTIAHAIALDNAPLVLDLSEVEFLGASTLGVIVRAREFLRHRSRSLTVRFPSTPAQRIIGLCDLDNLLGPATEGARAVPGEALRCAAEVPAAERPDRRERPTTPAPVPVQLSRARALRAHPASTKGGGRRVTKVTARRGS